MHLTESNYTAPLETSARELFENSFHSVSAACASSYRAKSAVGSGFTLKVSRDLGRLCFADHGHKAIDNYLGSGMSFG